MDPTHSIRTSFGFTEMVVGQYLGDLSTDDLFVRAVPGSNHIAWQWGHLIASERFILERIAPGKAGTLPDGFEAAHKKDTAAIDDPARFCSKQQYEELTAAMRSDTMRILGELSAEDLDRPVEKLIPQIQVVSDTFLFMSMHWLMHTGQWALVRRKLGRPPLF